MKFHYAALSAVLVSSVLAGAAQAGCGGAYPAVGPDGYPAGYVLVPNWAAEPCVSGKRKAHHRDPRGNDPFGTRDLGWYNKDSYAARGTEYDPAHPDPSVVSDAH